jgi:hypothetical protein
LFLAGRRRTRPRIGLDERLRRHHKAVRVRRGVMIIVLGAAVIAISLLLGRGSTSYDPIPGAPRAR